MGINNECSILYICTCMPDVFRCSVKMDSLDIDHICIIHVGRDVYMHMHACIFIFDCFYPQHSTYNKPRTQLPS